MLSTLLLFTLWMSPCFAEESLPPIAGLRLNPDLHLAVSDQSTAGDGFFFKASDARFEVTVRGVPQKNETAAKQMSLIEFANIKNLYSPHANPYRGQITSLVQCGKEFSPRTFAIKIGAIKANTLVAGANARKNFGTCVHSEISFWAQYFNFYDNKAQRFIEVRIFEKRDRMAAKGVTDAAEHMKKFSEKLFVEASL